MTNKTLTRIKTGISSNLIPIICTIFVVAGMIFFSEFLGEKEIYPVQVFLGVLILSMFGMGITGKISSDT